MSDLISRQNMIDAIEDESSKGHYSCFASYSDAQKFKQIVNELPSAERVGHWIIQDGQVVCSECGEPNRETDYCPFCGARMVSEDE